MPTPEFPQSPDSPDYSSRLATFLNMRVLQYVPDDLLSRAVHAAFISRTTNDTVILWEEFKHKMLKRSLKTGKFAFPGLIDVCFPQGYIGRSPVVSLLRERREDFESNYPEDVRYFAELHASLIDKGSYQFTQPLIQLYDNHFVLGSNEKKQFPCPVFSTVFDTNPNPTTYNLFQGARGGGYYGIGHSDYQNKLLLALRSSHNYGDELYKIFGDVGSVESFISANRRLLSADIILDTLEQPVSIDLDSVFRMQTLKSLLHPEGYYVISSELPPQESILDFSLHAATVVFGNPLYVYSNAGLIKDEYVYIKTAVFRNNSEGEL